MDVMKLLRAPRFALTFPTGVLPRSRALVLREPAGQHVQRVERRADSLDLVTRDCIRAR